MSRNFKRLLEARWDKANSAVCVGLDPDLDKLPTSIRSSAQPLFDFNKAIIDTTADHVCTYTLNSAFYEALGAVGIEQLKLSCDYIRETYPEVPILLDFKRGDIGNTNAKYAEFAFDYLKVDAVTLQPYQGGKALEPFFEYKDKGLFILIKTSNAGSDEFQNLNVEGRPLFEHVTERALSAWNKHGNIMIVAGATYSKELARIRQLAGDEVPILVPGIGAQGGEMEAMLEAGLNKNQAGLIVNSSRGIIYASSGNDFADAAGRETMKLKNAINQAIKTPSRHPELDSGSSRKDSGSSPE